MSRRFRRAKRFVPSVLAIVGFLLLVVALITDAKAAYSWSTNAWAWAWLLRRWEFPRVVTWRYTVGGTVVARGQTNSYDEAQRAVAAVVEEWSDR